MAHADKRMPSVTSAVAPNRVAAAIDLPTGMSVEQLLAAIHTAARAKFGEDTWAYSEHTADGSAVFNVGGELRRYDWVISDDGTVTLSATGELVERVTTFETVSGSFFARITASNGKRRAHARVAASGEGANHENGHKWFLPDSAEGLGSLVKPLSGAKVHAGKSGGKYDHRKGGESLGRYLDEGHELGYLSDVTWSDGAVNATINFHDDVPDEVVAAFVDLHVGLSIEASADRRPVVRDGKKYVELINFRHGSEPASVAIVTHPALAGEILRVAASRRSQPMPTETVIDPAAIAASAASATRALEDAQAALLLVRSERARMVVDARVRASGLSEKAQVFASRAFESDIAKGITPTDAAITAEIDSVRAALSGDARVSASGSVSVGAGPQDKFGLGLERLLLGGADQRVQKRFAEFSGHGEKLLASREQSAGIGQSARAHSWRALVRDTMGVSVEDLFRRGPGAKAVRAAVNLAQWGDVFENVLNKAGLAYQEDPSFEDWRKIVKIRNFTGSTLKQERAVTGGYANLPEVAEGGNYNAATTPGDEGHGYTVVKYGYTESWTREAQINDNYGQLAEIVQKMALAADRTKYEYFFDKLTIAGQPTMDYDSTAMYHANHGGNLATTALSATQLKARRLNMRKQADLTNGKRLGLEPKFLLVPVDLAETAFDALKPLAEYAPGSTTENAFLRTFGIEPIVVRHWTNTGDWFLEADPMRSTIPVYEAGFLDGKETAEIFVQDVANGGSVFERDAITVKIAMDYFGGSPLRDEAFDGNDV